MKIVALIPLRGGSTSIPHKNIRELAGHPLCYWVLKAATNCKKIDEVWISTDDQQIKRIVRGMDLGIKVLDRPAKYATSEASTESVMIHFAQKVDFDLLVTVQATSPLTTSSDFDAALTEFHNSKFDSMVTGVHWKRFFWELDGSPINYDPFHRPRRQEFSGWIMENGSFYLTTREILEKFHNRLAGKIGVYVMPEDTAIELDEPSDWTILETILMQRLSKRS